MNEAKIAELIAGIEKNERTLDKLQASLATALKHDVQVLGRTENAALIIAGLLENYYTCLETVFLRISQFFENSLSGQRWHAELLEKMTIHIEGVRIPAVSEGNHGNLWELLKFRHFRRYYFETGYDWDRLDLLVKKLTTAHPVVKQDLTRFIAFLRAIEP
ncbi:MAG: hypothetical protein ABSF77_02450 [Spirochaetia bacterium]|jgi:hypothetical protein